MEHKTLSIKLSVIYSIIYGALACIYPFLIYYFQEKGLSYMEMGIAFAVISITGVIVQPIWGFITDKYSNQRTVIIIAMCFSALFVYSLILANGFYVIILSIILLMSFQSPIVPIADAYSYEIIEQYKKLQYGKIRLMGSFGYAVVALLMGYIVKKTGINTSYVIYSILMFFGVLLLASIDYKGKGMRKNISFADIVDLIRYKKFILLMISVILTNIANGSNSSYMPVLIGKTGGDVTQLGIVWFIIAISELPAFYFGAKLIYKYGELNLYIFGVGLFALRYFLDSLCDDYVPVLVIQMMQGVTYTFYLMTSLQYLNKISPAKMRTSAITLHAAAIGIGAAVGNIGGGILLEYISIFTLYQILAFTCVICLYILIVLKKVE
ncbi:MFS transporter [Pelosinus sp. sgz500959]|uniref:MFS transporter n=1 Tax=Pelosinus sp. sgz500959 TaxID=3242472 RepID=UPI0036717659